MANIRERMEGKTVLLTGGAGFFGKVLTERLLSNCSGLERIYVVIRSKRGMDAKERWSKILKDKLFEKLQMDCPDIIDKKVVILDGDMSLINLGLSEDVLKELKNTVNVVFHSTASVRFDEPLHEALLSNTRGTLEMCKLAVGIKNLEPSVACTIASQYEEKIYDPGQDWETVLKLMESESPILMNTISKKILGSHPNTYTFSKTLSEKIVETYSPNYPTVISRPSVVIGITKYPLPGWIDNLNGVIGVTTGVCKGVIRVLLSENDVHLGAIPVDYAVNALIVSAWEKSKRLIKLNIKIYNAIKALSPFSHTVVFKNTKYRELWSKLRDEDSNVFYLAPPPDSNITYVMKCMHYGVKVYLFKENYEYNEYH